MSTEYGLSAILREIQDALLRRDFTSLSKAIGNANIEQCHFSEEAIQSYCLEDYALWWNEQREYAKTADIYKYVFSKKNKNTLRPSSITYYLNSLARSGQKDLAIEIGLEAIKENWGYVAICCWHVANYYMESGHYEDAKRFYLQAKDNSLPENYDIDADGKLLLIDDLLSFVDLWNKLKASNFLLEAEAGRDFRAIGYADILHLANTGDSHFSVAMVDWSKNNGLISDFLNSDAMSASIAFQSGYTNGVINSYLYEAIKDGEMSCLCPLTGELLKSNVSIYLANPTHIVAYFFNAKSPFFLFVDLYLGRRLGLYFTLNETYVHIDSSLDLTEIKKYAVITRLKYLLTTQWEMFKECFEQNNRLAILTNVIDHWGHTIGNEYTSLDYLFENGLLNRSSLVVSGWAEYVNIKEIFNLDLEQEVRLIEPEAITNYIANNRLFVIKAINRTYRLPLSLCRRVRENSNRLCAENVRQRFNKADFAFAVWIEVRSNDRICMNQEELACEVVRHLDEKKLGRTAIFIAGWSRKLTVDSDFDIRMIKDDSEIAERIAEKVSKFSNAACINIVGKTIYEKVVWAEEADIHICTYSSGIFFTYLARKRLVVHCNTGWYHSMTQSKLFSDIPDELQYSVDEASIKDCDFQNYNLRNHECKPEGLLKQLDLALTDQGLLKQ